MREMRFFKSKIIFIVVFATVINLYIHRREIVNPYVVEPDITSNYIMYCKDSALFSNDMFCQYVKRTFPFGPLSGKTAKNLLLSISLIYYFLGAWFFAALAWALSLPQFLAFISILYSIIAAVFVFKIGGLFCKKPLNSFYLAFFYLIYSATMDSFFGGLPRGLGFILICAVYYYLCKGQLRNIFLCIFLSILFDLHILPVVVLAFILSVYKKYFKKDYKIKEILYYSAVFTLVAFIIYLSGIASKGPFHTYLKSHMEWKWYLKDSFRENAFINFISNFILNIQEHSIMYKYSTLFLLCANCFLLFFKPKYRLLTQGEIIFVYSSILSFIITLPFSLGIASRQFIFPLPLFIIILFWKQIIYKLGREHKAIALLAFVAAFIFVVFNKYSNELANFSHKKKYFEYISSLPKDALIAGHPDDIVYVPFFCKRPVFYDPLWARIDNFFDDEMKGVIKTRKSRLLEALYRPGLDKAIDFLAKNNITHLVISENYYSRDYFLRAKDWTEVAKMEISDLPPCPKNNSYEFAVLAAARKYGKSIAKGIYILNCKDIKTR